MDRYSPQIKRHEYAQDSVIMCKSKDNGKYVEYSKAMAEIASLQAEIDSLMLEYCPKDMTEEQINNYNEAQVSVPDKEWLDIPDFLRTNKER